MAKVDYRFEIGSGVYFVEDSQVMRGTVGKVFITNDGSEEVKYKIAANGTEFIVPEGGIFATKDDLQTHISTALETIDEEVEDNANMEE